MHAEEDGTEQDQFDFYSPDRKHMINGCLKESLSI
jgi:hypothetical protein